MTKRVIVGELPVGGQEPLIASAVRWGDLLFLSGRAPIDTTTLDRPTGRAPFTSVGNGSSTVMIGSGAHRPGAAHDQVAGTVRPESAEDVKSHSVLDSVERTAPSFATPSRIAMSR